MHSSKACTSAAGATLDKLMDQVEEQTELIDIDIIAHFETFRNFLGTIEKMMLGWAREQENKIKKPIIASESEVAPLVRCASLLHAKKCSMRNIRRCHTTMTFFEINLPGNTTHFTAWPLWSLGRIPREICAAYGLQRYRDTLCSNFHPIDRAISSLEYPSATTLSATRRPSVPYGLAVHPISGDVYVAERQTGLVSMYSSSLEYKKSYSRRRETDPFLNSPCGICFSVNGDFIYVACSKKSCVVILNKELDFVGHLLTASGEVFHFSNATCIAVDLTGFIYVTDQDVYKVLKFSPDFIHLQTGHLKPVLPDAAVVDEQNRLLIFPRAGDTIYIICKETLVLLDGFLTKKALANWNYLCRGPNAGFCLSEYNNGAVHLFSSDGKIVKSLQITHPMGISFGLDGSLYIASSYPSDLIKI